MKSGCWLIVLNAFTAGIILLAFMYSALVCLREKQSRALFFSLTLGIALPLPFLAVALLPLPGRHLIGAILLFLAFALPALLFLPDGKKIELKDDKPEIRYDERRIMFSRARLEPGSDRFSKYYRNHPEDRASDDSFRNKPGLLSLEATYAQPLAFAAAKAGFSSVQAFHTLLDETTDISEKTDIDAQRVSVFIKTWLQKMGAVSAGITVLRDYHLYSNIGRGDLYGEAVSLKHDYAIALTVEMNHENVACAPYAPIIMESALQYLNSGTMAMQVAEFIRALGYRSRAHIDGGYLVVCPLVARDAGLGEIGRMGLLMTPELGPRVRIAVVTTDMPLVPDQFSRDTSLLDFCRICKKCAETCPGQAIPYGERQISNGVLRWQINSEACFGYWCAVGTDCGRCISVCPYSHPANLMHNTIRFGVRKSALFRRFALQMDHLFYGRKPRPRSVPGWINS